MADDFAPFLPFVLQGFDDAGRRTAPPQYSREQMNAQSLANRQADPNRIRGAIFDTMQRMGADPGQASLLASPFNVFTPVADLADAEDAYQFAKRGEYGQAALAGGAALIPYVPYSAMFIGPGSRLYRQDMANDAKRMLSAGADPEDVWKATGTRLDADGILKQEVSDADAILSEGATDRIRQGGATLGEVMPHDVLEAAYPGMEKTNIIYEPGNQSFYGRFDPKTGNIHISEAGLARSGDELRNTLLHEIQHKVTMNLEGGASGGSSRMVMKEAAKPRIKAARMAFARFIKQNAPQEVEDMLGARPKIDDIVDMASDEHWMLPLIPRGQEQKYLDLLEATYPQADELFDEYKYLKGEIEARLTEARSMLSQSERDRLSPMYKEPSQAIGTDEWMMDQLAGQFREPVPESEQIVRRWPQASSQDAILHQGSYESVPGSSTDHMPGLGGASYPERQAHLAGTMNVMNDASGRDRLADAFGLQPGRTFTGPGVYEGGLNPGAQVPYGRMDPDAATAAEATRGLLLGQDGAAFHSAGGPGRDILDVNMGRTIHDQEMLDMMNEIRGRMGPEAFGAVAPIPTQTGARVLNFGVDPDQLRAAGRKFGQTSEMGMPNSNLIENDWSKARAGQTYLAKINTPEFRAAFDRSAPAIARDLLEAEARIGATYGKNAASQVTKLREIVAQGGYAGLMRAIQGGAIGAVAISVLSQIMPQYEGA